MSCIITETQAEYLSKMFMEQVILNFGMVAVVVVDANNRFRSTFEAMYKLLKLVFWPLAHGNHKVMSTEKYHRF